MKVILVGATGKLGLRVLSALLTHKHSVVAFVRSEAKLKTLVPASVLARTTVVEGDAKHSAQIQQAILDHGCDALVNTAGLAAMMPWQSSDFPEIVKAVVKGATDASVARGKPLRAWILGGMGTLTAPGTDAVLTSYLPLFQEHEQNLDLLTSLPAHALRWSFLCPSGMSAASPEISVPMTPAPAPLISAATYPPEWQESWVQRVPLIGGCLLLLSNAMRYLITYESAADFIAADLETGSDEWIGQRVGLIAASKKKQ
ncbi:MAG: hypothetical protein M1838_005904 [Thelocarpon superellum]|nr:MAG: hypothetical protein M1838_005904 [Thelocarpon superellum]